MSSDTWPRLATVFSGIGAPEAATPEWAHAWASEVDPFPSAVLAHRFPALPNLGDVTQITDADLKRHGPFDVLVGGSPCQDLSVAGKRAGLAGDRSSLFYHQVRIFHAARSIFRASGPRWLVWENVPGSFSSNKGRDFAEVVSAMAGLRGVTAPRYGWGKEGAAVGDHGLLEWATLDAQWFGVAQRRRRVFAVLDTGDWASRPPILLEPESLRGDSPPSRDARAGVTPILEAGARTGRSTSDQVGVNARGGPHGRLDLESKTFVCAFHGSQDPDPSGPVTHPLGRNMGLEACIAFDETQTTGLAVRRLTPQECERLQGLPDDWTLVPYRNGMAKDGPRYKALGNSMAVPAMRWILNAVAAATQRRR